VKDINIGAGSSRPSSHIAVDDTLFFSGGDAAAGRELWKSDGTESGTARVKDILLARAARFTSFVSLEGTLLFGANDGIAGAELWKSDGTEAGTVRVKDINRGPVPRSDDSRRLSWAERCSLKRSGRIAVMNCGRVMAARRARSG
jgi:ELWxxDGT repeat protein